MEELAKLADSGDQKAKEQIIQALRSPSPEDAISAITYVVGSKLTSDPEIRSALLDAYKRKLQNIKQGYAGLAEPETEALEEPEAASPESEAPATRQATENILDDRAKLVAALRSPFSEKAIMTIIDQDDPTLYGDPDVRSAVLGYIENHIRLVSGNKLSNAGLLIERFGFTSDDCEPLVAQILANNAHDFEYLSSALSLFPQPDPERLRQLGLEQLANNLQKGQQRNNPAIIKATGLRPEDLHTPQLQELASKIILQNLAAAEYDKGNELIASFGLSADFYQSAEAQAAFRQSIGAALDAKNIYYNLPKLLAFAKERGIQLDNPEFKLLVGRDLVRKMRSGNYSDCERIIDTPELGFTEEDGREAAIEASNEEILWHAYFENAKKRLDKFEIPISEVMPAVNRAMEIAMSNENHRDIDELIKSFNLKREDYKETAQKIAVKKLAGGQLQDYRKIVNNFNIKDKEIEPTQLQKSLESGLQQTLLNYRDIINREPDDYLRWLKSIKSEDQPVISDQDRLKAKDKLLTFLAGFEHHGKGYDRKGQPDECVLITAKLAQELGLSADDLSGQDIAILKQLAGKISNSSAILELPALQQTFDLPDIYDTPLIKKNAEAQLRKELTKDYTNGQEARYAKSLSGLMDPADREKMKKSPLVQSRIGVLINSLLGDTSYDTGIQKLALAFLPITDAKTLQDERLRKRAQDAFKHMLKRRDLAEAKELAVMFSLNQTKTNEAIDEKINDSLKHGHLQSFLGIADLFPRNKELLSRAIRTGLKEYVKYNDNVDLNFVQKVIDYIGDEEQARQLKGEILAESLTAIASYAATNDYTRAEKKDKLEQKEDSFQQLQDRLKPDQKTVIHNLAETIPTDYRLCGPNRSSRNSEYITQIENKEVEEIFRQAAKLAITDALDKADISMAGRIYALFRPAAKDLENAIYDALENTKTAGGLSPLISSLRKSNIEAFSQAAEAAVARTLEDSDILEFLEKDLTRLITEGKTAEARGLMRTYGLRVDGLKAPGLQQAMFKGLAAQIRQPGGLGDSWLMDIALPGSKPEEAFAFAQSEFGDFIAQVETVQPRLIEQAKKSPVLLFGLLAYESKADQFVAEINKNQFFGDALENNPRYGPLLMAKYPKLDRLSKANIVELFRHKAHILKDYPELDPNSTEFRLDMQEALKDYRRNTEIVRACRDAGVDMDGWLDFDQESRFALGKEKEHNYASQTQPAVERLEKTMGNYVGHAHQALADYKPELEKAHAPSPESQALAEKIAQQRKLLAFEQEKPEAERNQNKLIGINKGLEALLKRQQELKPVTVWQKIGGEVGRSKAAFADTLLTQKELAAVEDKIRKTNKAVIIEEDLAQLEKLKAKLESQIRKCREIFEGFENKLRDLLKPALGNTTEALLQSMHESAAEDIDHYQSDTRQLNEFFEQQNNRDDLEGRPMRIAIASRNPDVDLYLGNYTDCCIRIDSEYQGAESPISDYITDLGMHNVVITDEKTKTPIVAAWCFIGQDEHYDKILVVDNIEANTSYTAKHRAQLEIKLDDYLEKLAAASDIRMIYQGTDHNDLYTKRRITKASGKVGGYNRASGYYLEAEQKIRGHHNEEDDDDDEDFEEDEDAIVEWEEDENDNEDWEDDDDNDDDNDDQD